MNKLLSKRRSRLARATILGVVLILAGCGTHAASESAAGTSDGTASMRVIRDPDNPAWTAATAGERVASVDVIRDPDNPYLTSARAASQRDGGSAGSLGLR